MFNFCAIIFGDIVFIGLEGFFNGIGGFNIFIEVKHWIIFENLIILVNKIIINFILDFNRISKKHIYKT